MTSSSCTALSSIKVPLTCHAWARPIRDPATDQRYRPEWAPRSTLKSGGSAFYRVADGTSDYHGVVVRVEKRFGPAYKMVWGANPERLVTWRHLDLAVEIPHDGAAHL